MNDEPNGERTDAERAANERMRELGRRSGEARRRKREQREQLEPVTDREQAKVALRRALDGNNMAAMVAAAKALIEFDHSPLEGPMSVEDARAAGRTARRDRGPPSPSRPGVPDVRRQRHRGASFTQRGRAQDCRGRGGSLKLIEAHEHGERPSPYTVNV